MNKTEKARVVVKALLNLPDLPDASHRKVRSLARRNGNHLNHLYELALKVEGKRSSPAELEDDFYAPVGP